MTIPSPEGLTHELDSRFQQTLLRFTRSGSEGRWELGPIDEGEHVRVTLVGPHQGSAMTAEEQADLAFLRTIVPVEVLPYPVPATHGRSI